MHDTTTHSPTQRARVNTDPAPRMPFGVHKGKRLDEIPADYLLWLGCLNDLRQPLLGYVLKEMGRRIVALEQHPAKSAEEVMR